MDDVIDELLGRDDVTTNGPASRADIHAVARQFDAPLPEALVKLWRASDGVEIESLKAAIPAPSAVLEWLAADAWEQHLVERGFLPVLGDHQSNALAVSLRDPLAFRVLYLPHDDRSRLVYRDFESSLRALMDAADADRTADQLLRETDGDYPPDTPRPEEDQEAARAILATPHRRGNEWNHAVRLLDASNVEDFAKLLETDHFIRRDVRARMAEMTSPAIRELLRKDVTEFEAFAATFAAAVRAARMPAGERDDHGGRCIKIGERWYDMEAFFHRRHIPDAMPRMIQWIADHVAGRDPHTRPGNFFAD